ncbi:PREDICTED: prion-like-(Q/N-rich) domain-bearing protein 25 isoform X2 [Nicrophorus vespilloides]|nr:PREDICTED: prion-like-(Q/N-rich) domain-bearing protein 25 isoform X2 [Nicrophorus vespilloides]XP_017775095.1 PREDICTED: prion-like-(Q/N-rich) domain-bearing protein 25 isoform X2 [Nicrophorus vespilloides]XP_017775176.1 PREDICTED: prion-like-(Q/N-rich) domain-bearing protein 25 isoform X2 [Nicrophorus vespilloides]
MKSLIFLWFFLIATSKLQTLYVSNESCQYDKHCKDGSFCFGKDLNKSGLCKCILNFFIINPSNYKCVQAATKLGVPDSCEDQSQCTQKFRNSECNGRMCLCVTDFHESRNRCIKTKRFGDPCTDNEECDANTACTSGTCQCVDGYHDANNRCIINKYLGEFCGDLEECVENTMCDGVKCVCKIGFSESNNKCYESKYLGESCDSLSMCLDNTVCNNNICICNNGFHELEKKCIVSKYVGQSCVQQGECVETEVDCQNNICTKRKKSNAQTNKIHFVIIAVTIFIFLISIRNNLYQMIR